MKLRIRGIQFACVWERVKLPSWQRVTASRNRLSFHLAEGSFDLRSCALHRRNGDFRQLREQRNLGFGAQVLGQVWANSERVGLNHEQKVNGEASLTIVIEKDFQCLEPRPNEDQSDSFPNPAKGAACGHH